MRVYRYADCRDVPWKNGQGTTREIARYPEGPGDFAWRLSLAEVGQSGPFSPFPGYERIITLLRGDGFTLRFDGGGEHTLRTPFEPYRFDGGAAVSCVLDGGPSNDLNLMVRRNLAPTRCNVVGVSGRYDLKATSGVTRVVFCLSEELALGGGPNAFCAAQTMGLWDTAVFDAAETAQAAIVCRSVRPAMFFHALIADDGAALPNEEEG